MGQLGLATPLTCVTNPSADCFDYTLRKQSNFPWARFDEIDPEFLEERHSSDGSRPSSAPADVTLMGALECAVERGDIQAVRRMLTWGTELDSKVHDLLGHSIFLIAVESGQYDMVQLLIQAGVDLNEIPSSGYTSVQSAAAQGDARMVDVLLQARADPMARAAGDVSALHVAAENDHVEAMRHLLGARADVEAREAARNSTVLIHSARSGAVEAVHLLICWHASLTAVDNSGCAALAVAAQAGSIDVVLALLEHRAALEAQDANGRTALMQACAVGSKDVVRVLMDSGANKDVVDKNGETAVMENRIQPHDTPRASKGWSPLASCGTVHIDYIELCQSLPEGYVEKISLPSGGAARCVLKTSDKCAV